MPASGIPRSASTASCAPCCACTGAPRRGPWSGSSTGGRLCYGARSGARGGSTNVLARPRPEKKRKKAKPVQPPLPGMPPPEPPGTPRVLPMQLQIGDRMIDSTGEWEVVGRPYTTNGRKNAHVRVQRANQPGMTETKMGGAYEKVSVIRRAAAEKGKR